MFSGARIYAKTESSNPKDVAQVALCHRIAQALADLYPEHPWWVCGQPDNGTIGIGNMWLSPDYGYQMSSASLDDNPTEFKRKVMLAAGEVLERFNVSRTARGEALRAIYEPIQPLRAR